MMHDFKEIKLNNISELNKAYLNKIKSNHKTNKPNSILYIIIMLAFIILLTIVKFAGISLINHFIKSIFDRFICITYL